MAEQASTSPSIGEGGQQPVHIESLSISELHQLKRQFDDDLTQLRSSHSALDEAAERYKSSSTALDQLHATAENSDMLVPLTASIYVPGKLVNKDKVLIDIGTGFHVQKKVQDAHIYIERNIEMLNKQVKKLTSMIQEKQQLSEIMQQQIQQKYMLQQMASEQQQQQHG